MTSTVVPLQNMVGNLSYYIFPHPDFIGIGILIVLAFLMIRAKVPMPLVLMFSFLLFGSFGLAFSSIFTSLFYIVGGLGFALFGLVILTVMRRY